MDKVVAEMGIEHFKRWCQGKPLMVAQFATAFAVNADEICDILDTIRSGELTQHVPKFVSTSDWLEMYRDHRRVRDSVLKAFNIPFGKVRITPEIADGFVALCGMSERAKADPEKQKALVQGLIEQWGWNDPATFAKAMSEAKENAALLVQQHEANVSQVLGGGTADYEETEETEKHFSEIMFLLFVWLPCLLETGLYPGQLLCKARHAVRQTDGEPAWRALESLLGMDKQALQEPRIWSYFLEAQALGNQGATDILRALNGKPDRTVKRQRCKVSLASVVWVIARGLGHPLSVPEVRGLFDAIAQDKGNPRDLDLPEDDGALKKGIQRDKSFWRNFENRDKKAV